jgi:hypothetical protein
LLRQFFAGRCETHGLALKEVLETPSTISSINTANIIELDMEQIALFRLPIWSEEMRPGHR